VPDKMDIFLSLVSLSN